MQRGPRLIVRGRIVNLEQDDFLTVLLVEVEPFAIGIVGGVEHLAVGLAVDVVDLHQLVSPERAGIAKSERVVADSAGKGWAPDAVVRTRVL